VQDNCSNDEVYFTTMKGDEYGCTSDLLTILASKEYKTTGSYLNFDR